MKSRIERYSEEKQIPKRTDKNSFLYDKIYVQKHDPDNNVTVIDNVNEIDINKIKEMIGNREDYKKLKQYQSISNKLDNEIEINTKYNIDEIDSKNYDINEIIERKRNNQGTDYEDDKVRKISDTQYDILKDLNIENHNETTEEEKQEQLKDLINTIVKEKTINLAKTNLDFFADLRATDEEKELEDTTTTIESEKINAKELENKDNTFYSSNKLFSKDDFEEEENKKPKKEKKEKGDLVFKLTIGILVTLIILVLVFIILIL